MMSGRGVGGYPDILHQSKAGKGRTKPHPCMVLMLVILRRLSGVPFAEAGPKPHVVYILCRLRNGPQTLATQTLNP